MDTLETYTPQASVIGAILLEPRLMGEAMTILSQDDFLSANCRIAWQAMTKLFREGKTVDVILLRDALSGFQNAAAFLSDCMNAAPYAGNFHAHVQALKEQAMFSRLKELGNQIAEASTLEELMGHLSKANETSIRRGARSRRSMGQMFQSFAHRHAADIVPDYIPWPLKQLNDGIKVGKGKFVVIGGYPSDGKTAFALQAAVCQAESGQRVAFYSLETDEDTAEDRVIAAMAGISMEVIQDNKLGDQDWTRYAIAAEKAGIQFDVIPAADMTVDDIRADALAHRYSVIYIDYLQLITSTIRNHNFSRFDEVSAISRNLQQLARTTRITVVALSQLSRPAEDKKGNIPAPTMRSLRESGQIEQDADVILLVYRLNPNELRATRHLDIAKNKQGPTGHFALDFDGIHQLFSISRGVRPEGMPKAIKSTHTTPVIGKGDRNEDYPQLTMEDPQLPF